MKNLLALIGLLALCLFVSCSKSDDNQSSSKYPKSCTCTTVTTGPDGVIISTVSNTVEITEGECSDGNSSVNANGASIVISCK